MANVSVSSAMTTITHAIESLQEEVIDLSKRKVKAKNGKVVWEASSEGQSSSGGE